MVRGQAIGTVGPDAEALGAAHLHLEMRWDASVPASYWPISAGHDDTWIRELFVSPSQFIGSHRFCFVPQEERSLLLVDTARRRLRLYEDAKKVSDYEVGLALKDGQKRVAQDFRTPRGMYFVIEKSRGPFPPPWGRFYGGRWMKVNYPGAYDAVWGRAHGLISDEQRQEIVAAWARRDSTPQQTRLGSGIGFHGWASDWDDAGPRRMSWGCVVMHTEDIDAIFDRVPIGAMVVIF